VSSKPLSIADPPTFRIGAVAKLTGISLHLLRMWERRYEVVTPTRSDGGDRLYTQSDVDRLRLVKLLYDAGHSIGRIARLSSQELTAMVPRREPPPPLHAASSDPPSEAAEQFLEAITSLDMTTAERVLSRAAMVLGPREVALRVLVPVLRETGERWADGRFSVAQEHAAAAVLRSHLGSLMRAHAADPSAPCAVCTTPAGELHEFGALVASLFTAALGWRVVYLGPNLPAHEIVRAAELGGARVVLLSAVMGSKRLADELARIRAGLGPTVELIVGGAGVEQLTVLPSGITHLSDLSDLQRHLIPIS
jgi:DNA-binding transcriptional MerR regulator/methylmalonyl-CoA mutase cobalamin-binding subunit